MISVFSEDDKCGQIVASFCFSVKDDRNDAASEICRLTKDDNMSIASTL